MRRDHRNFTVIRVRARGNTCRSRICAGEGLYGSIENGGNRLVEGFAVMTSSGSVWIWVSRRRRDGDWLDVSLKDSGGAGVATSSKRSGFSRKRGIERTDTEVGEDGMDAGERVMRSEFLLGDPRDADEEFWKDLREELRGK